MFRNKRAATPFIANDTVNNVEPLLPEGDDFIRFYKHADLAQKARLLMIMSAAELQALRDFYLQKLDESLTRLETLHHPASIPGRIMETEIKANKLSITTGLHIMHQAIDLADTLDTSPIFQQKANQFTQSVNQIKHEANQHLFYGACTAFAAAICLAGVIVLSVLAFGPSPLLKSTDVIGAIVSSTVLGAYQIPVFSFFFNKWRNEKSMAVKMDAFGTAMQQTHSNNTPNANTL